MAMSLRKLSITKAVLCCWLLACLAVLVFAYFHQGQSEATQGFGIVMACLTFPLGAGAGMLAIASLGALYPSGFAGSALFWVISVIGGYLQWFVIVPRVFKPKPAAI
jgi:hypothetical protein